MRNAIFFVVLAFLLAGCNGKGPALELKTEVDVASDKALPVRVVPQNEEPLPVKIDAQDQEPLPVRIKVQDEEPLSVKINAMDDEPLPVKMVLDETQSWVVIVLLVVAIVIAGAAFGAAVAAWRAACNTRKALEKLRIK